MTSPNFDLVRSTCRSTPWGVFAVYGMLTGAFLGLGWLGELPGGMRLAWGLAGLAVWNLLEYGIHRFLFHRNLAWAPWNHLTYGLHMYHHGHPDEREYVPVPIRFSLPIMTVVMATVALVARQLAAVSAFGVGLGLCYLYFEWIHARIHAAVPRSWLARRVHAFHLHHHYRSTAHNYGLSFPFVDLLVGTARWPRD